MGLGPQQPETGFVLTRDRARARLGFVRREEVEHPAVSHPADACLFGGPYGLRGERHCARSRFRVKPLGTDVPWTGWQRSQVSLFPFHTFPQTPHGLAVMGQPVIGVPRERRSHSVRGVSGLRPAQLSLFLLPGLCLTLRRFGEGAPRSSRRHGVVGILAQPWGHLQGAEWYSGEVLHGTMASQSLGGSSLDTAPE